MKWSLPNPLAATIQVQNWSTLSFWKYPVTDTSPLLAPAVEPLTLIVGFITPVPWQAWHVTESPLEATLPVPWQVGQVIFPVPWHVGHSAFTNAIFKAASKRIEIKATINSLFFRSAHLSRNCLNAEVWFRIIPNFFVLRVERGIFDDITPYTHLDAYYN